MGLAIEKRTFSDSEFQAFEERLQACLKALRTMLNEDRLLKGPISLGAELEVYLVDRNGGPANVSPKLLNANQDPRLVSELNRHNLEMNLSPVDGAGTPFSSIAAEMREVLVHADSLARELDAQVLPIGILPTLRQHHLGPEALTPQIRYEVLAERLRAVRGARFDIDIDGVEPLAATSDVITPEGANTAFQLHIKVDPTDFVDTFNAALLTAPLLLALGANSPFFLGHRLWQETRVALFKQSVDTRRLEGARWREPPRVSFGNGWLRNSPYEPFAETVAIYPPLLAPLSDQDPRQAMAAGRSPELRELRLHMGTTWPWVRAVYDHVPGPHLRIEIRALPSGPTVEDMVANAALAAGLAVGARRRMDVVLPAIPFRYAEHNFYRAAKHGLEARLIWPWRGQNTLREESIDDVLAMMLPMADEGLDEIGVEAVERQRLLGTIVERLEARQTGATWQCDRVERFERDDRMPRAQALQAMVQRYARLTRIGAPVARWPKG